MIYQLTVANDEVAEYVESIGKTNIISILPVLYKYSEDGLNTYHGQKSETVGTAIVDKFLIIYER